MVESAGGLVALLPPLATWGLRVYRWSNATKPKKGPGPKFPVPGRKETIQAAISAAVVFVYCAVSVIFGQLNDALGDLANAKKILGANQVEINRLKNELLPKIKRGDVVFAVSSFKKEGLTRLEVDLKNRGTRSIKDYWIGLSIPGCRLKPHEVPRRINWQQDRGAHSITFYDSDNPIHPGETMGFTPNPILECDKSGTIGGTATLSMQDSPRMDYAVTIQANGP